MPAQSKHQNLMVFFVLRFFVSSRLAVSTFHLDSE
jgi:hypothetical protein